MSEITKETYNKGYQDALEDYGIVCTHNSSCSECPVGIAKGSEITCAEFMKKFPSLMQSLLLGAKGKQHSYFHEYCMRFPQSTVTLDDISDCVCRKVIFEGDNSCTGGDCKQCWNEAYIGDISEK